MDLSDWRRLQMSVPGGFLGEGRGTTLCALQGAGAGAGPGLPETGPQDRFSRLLLDDASSFSFYF